MYDQAFSSSVLRGAKQSSFLDELLAAILNQSQEQYRLDQDDRTDEADHKENAGQYCERVEKSSRDFKSWRRYVIQCIGVTSDERRTSAKLHLLRTIDMMRQDMRSSARLMQSFLEE